MNEPYMINHFSLNLPKGRGQGDATSLLRHLATTIESMDKKIEIQDIVFKNESDENGDDWPTFTVYYHIAE